MNRYHSRFKDCSWHMDQFPKASVGGVGGIGSWLSLFLGRIGVPITAYDMDTVDYTNMGGQLYPINAIGQSKVNTIKKVVHDFCGHTLFTANGELTTETKVERISFACFDSIKARKIMFNSWKKENSMNILAEPQVFIDGRMTVESFQVFIVTPERIKEYEETLFDDNSIEEPICSMKATSHIGAMIGSYMTQAFTNYITNFVEMMEVRDLPFSSRYEAAFLDKFDF